MTYRRTWFSYVLWMLYTILCIVLLVAAGDVWVSYFAGYPYAKGFPDSIMAPFAGLSDNALTVLGLLVLPGTAILYWVIRCIAVRIGKKCTWKGQAVRIFEGVIVTLALAGGIFLRIDCARFFISTLAEGGSYAQGLVSGMDYYEIAVVTAGKGIPAMVYGAAYLYVQCLSVVLLFLGNKVASAIVLQVFLQIVGMVLAYLVARKLAGRLPACTVLIYMACSFSCLKMLVYFSPEWLFFDLYMAVMLIAVSFVKGFCASHLKKRSALLCAAAVGIAIGALTYLDVMAVTLLTVFVAVAIGRKERQEGTEAYHSAGINAAVMLTALFACVLGWFMVMAAVCYGRGDTLQKGLGAWADFYMRNMRVSGFTSMYPYILDIYIMGMLVVPAAFLVFEFFRSGREQNYMLWILLCILVAPTPRAVMGANPFGIISFYIWGVLAGLGLQNCMFGGKREVLQAVIEEINSAAEEAETAGKGEIAEPADGGRKTEIETRINIVEEIEKIHEAEVGGSVHEAQPPRYIENPLPLPKKHVKKKMDYQYPVEDKDMEFDVDISENDDFDIQ